MTTNSSNIQTVVLNGERFVIVPEAEYRQLVALPAADAEGRRPAVAAMRTILGRDIAADRQRAGWSQAELARRAGIRVETLSRIENGKHTPSVSTVQKLDAAIQTGTKRKARVRR
jgi:ribosome-binding protein aMBF1 (putative translation factor)